MGIRNMKTVTVDGTIYQVPKDIKEDVLKIVAAWPDGSCEAEAPLSGISVGEATMGLTETVKKVRAELKKAKADLKYTKDSLEQVTDIINELPKSVKNKYFS